MICREISIAAARARYCVLESIQDLNFMFNAFKPRYNFGQEENRLSLAFMSLTEIVMGADKNWAQF